mgnify:CR=1 FL=1
MNMPRVLVTVVAIWVFGLTAWAPWWRYRYDYDVVATAERDAATWGKFWESQGKAWAPDLETYVGPVALNEIDAYEVHDWLPLNYVQFGTILACWACCLVWLRVVEVSWPPSEKSEEDSL